MTDRTRTLAAVVLQALLLAGTTVPSALFVVLRAQYGWSAADVGTIFAVYVLSLLPTLLLYGRIADRVGRRGSAALGVGLALVGLIAFAAATSVPVAAAARLIQGVAVGVASGSLTAVISQMHRGTLPAGVVTAVASNLGLMSGALITALAYDATHALVPAFVPMIVLTAVLAACIPALPGRTGAGADDEAPLPWAVVVPAMAFALATTFVGWSGVSLFLAMVPAYLAAALALHDPIVGAGVIVAVQLASIAGTVLLRQWPPLRGGTLGPAAVVIGLACLVAGVAAGGPAGAAGIVVSTLLVGAGGGVAFAAGVGSCARVARGRRARLFAWLYVAAYLGFGLPSWLVGALAVSTSFTIAFSIVIAGLAVVAIVLPSLARGARPAPVQA